MSNTFNLGNGNWATKKEAVLAYNSENNNFKPLPFSFDRASTATVVNKDGLIETVGVDEPRIDFTDNTKGHLLLEPQRRNIITNSEQFVDAPTGNTNMDLFSGTITNNNTTSPDGNTKGMKFTISSGSGAVLRIYQSDLSTSANTTFSIYAKKGTTDSLSINISGGTATTATLTDEWQRFSTTNTSSGSKFLDVEISGSAGEYIYIFGIQAEAGSYATSYIPTSGSAVTRSADACSQTVPDGVIGQTEGTILVNFIRKPQSNGTAGLFGISSSNNNDRVIIWNNFSLDGLGLQIKANGSNITGNQSLGTFDDGENYKIAISYKSGEIKVYVNGSSILNLTDSFTFASDINTVIVNSYQLGIVNEPSPFKDLKLYNTALSDSELQALTSG
jgi:hypothetical protein